MCRYNCTLFQLNVWVGSNILNFILYEKAVLKQRLGSTFSRLLKFLQHIFPLLSRTLNLRHFRVNA